LNNLLAPKTISAKPKAILIILVNIEFISRRFWISDMVKIILK
jgi:hypothetical protein